MRMTKKTADLRQVFRLSLLVFSAALSAGCSKPANETHFLADDFFVTVVARGNELKATKAVGVKPIATRSECEAALTNAVCETTAATSQISNNYASVKCSSGGAQYVPALMAIYDETPEFMRPSLCSLDRIFISDGIASTAFASSVTDSMGRRIGGYVGMRRGTFLQQPSAHALVSWKEQLAFGGSTDFLANDPKLVQLSYNLKLTNLKQDGLFYVLMHELGHLIDFNNAVNSTSGAVTEWSRLSWDGGTDVPLHQASFFKRDDFCFYNCQNYLNVSDAKEIYTSLQKSAFITTYSSMNPWEDFAEFWAWHLMIEFKNPDFEITVPGEVTLKMNEGFAANPQIKNKLEFIGQLWNSTDLKVDNRQP